MPDSQPDVSHTRPIAPWVGLVLLLLCLASAMVYDLYFDYRNIYLEAQLHLRHQVGIVHENLSKRLQSTSNAIDAVREDWRWLSAKPGGLAHINARLQALTASMVGVRTFAVMDAEGVIVASNQPALIGQNFRNSERYNVIREAANPNLMHLSRPYVSPLNVRVISAGKMIPDAQGKFAGYVLAILDPDHFEALMRSVLFSPEMRASLIHGDGEVILRLPDPEGLTGTNLNARPDSLFARFARSGESSLMLDSRSGATGKDLLGLLSQVRPESTPVDKPLVFAALLEKEAMYAPWRSELYFRLTVFALVALLSSLILALYQRRQQAFAQLAIERADERQRADTVIKTMAEQLSLALDGADMGAYHWNVKTGEIVWTDTYRRIMRQDKSIAPCYESWLASVHPDDRDMADRTVRSALESRRDLDIEYRIQLADGKLGWIASKGRFFAGDDGQIAHMEGIVCDITGRKEADDRLAERTRQIELLNVQLEKRALDAETATRAKEAFMRAVSHELRTPLNHIMSAGEVLSRGELLPRQTRWVGMISDAARELLRKVTEVIELTYLAEGRLKLEHLDFSPSQMIEEVRLMLALRAESKGLSISVDLDAKLPEQLSGDPIRLSQALYNLLDNAIKFTDAGAITISAATLAQDTDGVLLRFEVADTGIGISPTALDALLSDQHQFRQLDEREARKYGGLGVGLASVRELARLMGGNLGGTSTPGQGSRFWFTARLNPGDPAGAAYNL